MKLRDPLIKNFHSNELRPIMTDNKYHSPEVSESDTENPNKRMVVIRDLEWRSSTVSFIYLKFFKNRDVLIII